MKNRLFLLILLLCCFYFSVHAVEKQEVKDMNIFTREQWGVDEEYGYRDSTYWKEKIEKWQKNAEKSLTDAQKKAQEKATALSKEKIKYINTYFAKENTTTEIIDSKEGRPLAWPIKKSDYVNAIVVHHTHSEYDDSYEGIKDIYKYHSLSKSWGDIGYNYIIGYDGEIFEGRQGGYYVVAAHSVWNNISTVGIAIMGNYETKGINELQYRSLEKLIQHLSLKYGIDLGKEYHYNMECVSDDCAAFPLQTQKLSTLVGHRDTGHTECPGDELYKQIAEIRTNNLEFTRGFIPVKRGEENPNLEVIPQQKETLSASGKILLTLKRYKKEKLKELQTIVEKKIENEQNESTRKKLQALKILIERSLEK